MFIKVNCVFLDKDGFKCLHKDKPKDFFFFKPTCMEPFKKCKLKKKNTRSPLYSPPPQNVIRKGEINHNELY
jgi:hypothetical protein